MERKYIALLVGVYGAGLLLCGWIISGMDPVYVPIDLRSADYWREKAIHNADELRKCRDDRGACDENLDSCTAYIGNMIFDGKATTRGKHGD